MFHIVMLLLFSSIMFAAVYQFWFNKNDMVMMMMTPTGALKTTVFDAMSLFLPSFKRSDVQIRQDVIDCRRAIANDERTWSGSLDSLHSGRLSRD